MASTNTPPPSSNHNPDINQCITTIIAESKAQSTRNQANLHLACVGLAAIIGREQQGAHGQLNHEDSAFLITKTPAMRELVTNPQLFRVLLFMLSSYHGTHQNVDTTDANRQARKRSLSEDNTFNARKKQMLTTPPPNKQELHSARHSSQFQLSGTIASASMDSAGHLQVFAAAVLYSVLQHIDHWPIELMRVFAEDAFGQRVWIENEMCKDLVSNLYMSLRENARDDTVDSVTSSIADEIGSYFSSLAATIESNSGSNHYIQSHIIVSSQQRPPSAKEVRAQSRQIDVIDDSSSSSSGEEEILESNSMDVKSAVPLHQYKVPASVDILQKLFERSERSNQSIRSRYIAHNLDLAYEAVSESLTERLNSKSRQNSRLVQALPKFLCIPRVRCLASRHLFKWLQSPALASLARNLLTSMTKALPNRDPPLPDDVEMLDNLLKMKLKANQFSVHIEAIRSIAARVPTRAVAKQVFMHCLAGEKSNDGDNILNPGHDHLEILRSVYQVLNSSSAAESLASAVIDLTADSHVQSYSKIIRIVANTLGHQFDACAFTENLVKFKTGVSSNISNANDNARLIFDSAILVGANASDPKLKIKIASLRKSILRWCVTDLGKIYHKAISQEENQRANVIYNGNGVVKMGPEEADYSSYLHPRSIVKNGSIYKFISTTSCLLFLNRPSVSFIQREIDTEELDYIDSIIFEMAAIDDEMLEIVLMGCPYQITPSTAVALIESLVYGAYKCEDIPIKSSTICKLYDLSVYSLHFKSTSEDSNKLPQLAHSGLWWRVTAIALVMCSLSSSVGSEMWHENPTLRALIKMSTSQKYRFPTTDFNDTEKELVRTEDRKAKEQEASIAEYLFTSPKSGDTIKPEPVPQRAPERQGLRSSARQKEKRERNFALEQERIAAVKHAEQIRLRRQMKILTKSIIIFSPKQYQRKPPKESTDLILFINKKFNLAHRFRASVEPDYLLQTIGDGRSSIERAYDWLIPIISRDSEVIHRLQPSSTCFLLLKAYGTEAGQNRDLIELSAPLLSHVKKCLKGEFGKNHSLMALELLLADIADETTDRRRCSRKVLQKAIPNNFGFCGWLQELINLPNNDVLIPLTVKYLSRALAYERGKVLSAYVLSLYKYNKLMRDKFDFVTTICEMISSRPHVFTDSMNCSKMMQTLILREIEESFNEAISGKEYSNTIEEASLVTMKISCKTIIISASLLRAAVVVISSWKDVDEDNYNTNANEKAAKIDADDCFNRLLECLIISARLSNSDDEKTVTGLASARRRDNSPLVLIEDWISLSRANTSIVAKHAALAAPEMFLPRLLLCCGIPQLSFVTMLSRINKIGNASSDPNKVFRDLLSSPTIIQWGLTKIGSRRVIKRKLLERILSYTRKKHDVDNTKDLEHSSFVLWLKSECTVSAKINQLPPPSKNNYFKSCVIEKSDGEQYILIENNEICDISDNAVTPTDLAPTAAITEDFIRECIENEKHDVLEESLQLIEVAMLRNQTNYNTSAIALLQIHSLFQGDARFVRIILKWIPRLFQMNKDNLASSTIFFDIARKYCIPLKICMLIVSGCTMKWSRGQILECRKWISSQQTQKLWTNQLSQQLALRFLALTPEHDSDLDESACLVDLCFDSFEIEERSENEDLNVFRMTNVSPDWLTVIMHLVERDLSSLNLVFSNMLNRINTKSQLEMTYSAVVLCLYTVYPFMATLTETILKTVLINGARDHSKAWLNCRCPLDSQIKAMISNLFKSPHKALLQSTMQIFNQHPLLLMRHLALIEQGLIADGSGLNSDGSPLTTRGRIQGKSPELIAVINEREVKVSILHWGYSFSEPVWSSALDLLLSIPSEILFKVGVETGLAEIMSVYSKLFSVQANELNAESNISQLRAKFSRLTSSFMNFNPEKCQLIMRN